MQYQITNTNIVLFGFSIKQKKSNKINGKNWTKRKEQRTKRKEQGVKSRRQRAKSRN